MLSYYFIFFIFSSILLINNSEKPIKILFPFIILTLFSGLRGASGGDYCNYFNIFNATTSYYDLYINYIVQIKTGIQDFGFIFLISTIKIFFSNPTLIFLFISAIAIGLNLYAFKKVSPLFYGSLLIYFSHAFIYKEMAQIRHGIASALLLICIFFLIEKKIFRYFLFLFFAISNHISSIVGILFILIKKYKISRNIILAIILLFLLFVYLGVDIIIVKFVEESGYLPARYFYYRETVTEGGTIGIFSNITTVKHLIIISTCIFFYKQLIIKYGELFRFLFTIYCFGLMWLILFNSYSILAARVATFFTMVEVFIVPMLLIFLTNKNFAKIIIIFYAFLHLSYNMFLTQEVRYAGLIFFDSTDKCTTQEF